MLTPKIINVRYPKFNFKKPDYVPIYQDRARRLQEVRTDRTKLVAMLKHYECSETGHIDFVQDWFMTYDPRCQPAWMPFILFPKQIEYLNWLREKYENKNDGLAEKSRDVGFTWLNIAFALWLWRFRSGSKISFGSRKQDLVDKIGDPDSIFEKIRTCLVYIPPEVLPYGFNYSVHVPFLKIINPDNGNTITGEAGDNIGRGGRSSMYFKDESAFYEHPETIDAALSQNSDVKIDCSTPNGAGNPFYTKRHSGLIDVFTFHWKDDPRKDLAWYNYQKRTLTPVIVAQEIDIDYHASIEGVCIPAEWVRSAINLELEESGTRTAGLDVADNDGGGDDNAWCFRHGVVLKKIEVWTAGNTTQTARRAHLLSSQNNVEHLNYDNIGVGSGIKGELWSLDQKANYSFSHAGINFGSKKLPGFFAPGKTNKDMFANLKAKLWWDLRCRFERTWEHVNKIKEHDVDKLISIPDNPKLIAQLSTARVFANEAGKMQMVSKKVMKIGGIQSPNEAEAVVYCYSENRSTAQLMAKRTGLQKKVANNGS